MADGIFDDHEHHRLIIRAVDSTPEQRAALRALARAVMDEHGALPGQETAREPGTGEPTMAPWIELTDTPPWITDAYREAMGLP